MTLTNRLRAARYRQLGDEDESGFTLVEMLIVILVIAILIGIAIGTYLGVTKSAGRAAAESNLETAYTAAQAAFTSNNQSFVGLSVSNFQSSEPSLTWTNGASSADNVISVATLSSPSNSQEGGVDLAAYNKYDTTCYHITDDPAVGAVRWLQTGSSPTTCTASAGGEPSGATTW